MDQSIGQPPPADGSSNRITIDKEIDFPRRYQEAKTVVWDHCCQGIKKKIFLKPTTVKVPAKKKAATKVKSLLLLTDVIWKLLSKAIVMKNDDITDVEGSDNESDTNFNPSSNELDCPLSDSSRVLK